MFQPGDKPHLRAYATPAQPDRSVGDLFSFEEARAFTNLSV
jgi:hypothetical protein